MPEFSREEVDAEFAKYVERGKANDWSAWADQFTEDARYVEHEYGVFEGREAIRAWIVETMASVSGMSFPHDWHVSVVRREASRARARAVEPSGGDHS